MAEGLVPADFFAVRTPLLPFDALLDWSGPGCRLPAAPGDSDADVQSERARLRASLRRFIERPEIAEALFVASPSLVDSLPHWLEKPDGERGQKVERGLVRYFSRMAGRATPYGLFSGVAVGAISGATRLELGEQRRWRHTRLDMDLVLELAAALASDPELKAQLHYRPNSSLYRVGDRIRYLESVASDLGRDYHLASATRTPYLEVALQRARGGARLDEIAAAVAAEEPDVPLEEIQEYLGSLLERQILVPQLEPPVTGREPLEHLLSELEPYPSTGKVRAALQGAGEAISAMDALGRAAPQDYRDLAKRLAVLPVKVHLERMLQVDLFKSCEMTLGPDVLREVARGVSILRAVHGQAPAGLRRFREAFVARYGRGEVPLAEALDEDSGIGFASGQAPTGIAAPLVGELPPLPVPGAPEERFPTAHRLLAHKLVETLRRGATELELDDGDVKAIARARAERHDFLLELPESVAVMASLSASSAEAFARGHFRLWLDGPFGSSVAVSMGRFCHGHPGLLEKLRALVHREEASRPDAVYAEIIHLPAGRVGNVVLRPILREREIPYLGRAGVPAEGQIPLDDLWLSVSDGRIVLRSRRLGREVRPRLGCAHFAASPRNPGLYRFLEALWRAENAGSISWDWGSLVGAEFLPRVTHGRLVLCRAQWTLSRERIATIADARGRALLQAVARQREALGLPRFVGLADGDLVLPVDLENVLSVESMAQLLRRRSRATLSELVQPSELCVRGHDGRYVHQLIVPFVREPSGSPPPEARTPPSGSEPARLHLPGSEWLCARFSTSGAQADRVVMDVCARAAENEGSSWFFERSDVPGPEIRLVLHGDASRLWREVWPRIQTSAEEAAANGVVFRVQLDSYQREVERFGGEEGAALGEAFSAIDSDVVLRLLSLWSQGEDAEAAAVHRSRLMIRSVDELLSTFGLDLGQRHALAAALAARLKRERRVPPEYDQHLAALFRKVRGELTDLLDRRRDATSEYQAWLELLEQRARRLEPVVRELRSLEMKGALLRPLSDLWEECVQIHVNRLAPWGWFEHQVLAADFLQRLLGSALARQ